MGPFAPWHCCSLKEALGKAVQVVACTQIARLAVADGEQCIENDKTLYFTQKILGR